VPLADLTLLQADAPQVQQGAAQLTSLAAIPPADLAYLQANAAEVAKAKRDHPGEWQTWWRICFAGQLPCIALVFLLTWHWSPRKARGDDLEHERMVDRELERLHRGPGGPGRLLPSTG
jgi:MFS transporter, ACS family, D-galactonate transporter